MSYYNEDLKKTVALLKKNIYFFPIIILISLLLIFSLITYTSLNNFKDKEMNLLKTEFIKKSKGFSKGHVNKVLSEINKIKNNTIPDLNKKLLSKNEDALKIIYSIYNKHKEEGVDRIKKIISDALSPIRFFNDRGYYFIIDNKTNHSLIHPHEQFVNKDISTFKDANGLLVLDHYREVLKKSDDNIGFTKIEFIKPTKNAFEETTKYINIIYIPELDWILGTGEYYEDLIKENKQKFLDKLEKSKYGKNGYFWIHNKDYILTMHPYRKEALGQSDEFFKDSKGEYFVQKFIDKAILQQEGEGVFVEYLWSKPDTNLETEKVSYVVYIEDWEWIIGTGVYLEDINKIIKTQQSDYDDKIFALFQNIVGVFIIFFIIVIIISIKLSDIIKKHFVKYSNELTFINNNLEKIVIQRTNELNLINKDLENRINKAVKKNTQQELALLEQSKFVQLGEMIGYIAHQWRQPLSVISSSSTGIQMKKEFGLLNDEDLDEALSYINKNTQFLSETIDNFRDFVKEKREPSIVNVKDRIEKILGIIESSLNNSFIKVEKNLYNKEPLEIIIVLGELSQVLINLLNNSRDAFLENKDSDRLIKISTYRDNMNVVILIEDNAGGIDENIISRIFDPYFTTKHQSQGTGIGLYMSKKIIESHLKGKISVENIENGVQFKILLPLNPANI